MRKHLLKFFLLGVLLLGFIISNYSQEYTLARKAEMIDSAYDARVEKYLQRCFPEYAVRIKYQKDSFDICSIENALWLAPDIDDGQFQVLKKLMISMAHYYNSNNMPVLFDYGYVPGSIDVHFDRMFSRKAIYVTSLEKWATHSKAIELLAVFNKITESYLANSADLKTYTK